MQLHAISRCQKPRDASEDDPNELPMSYIHCERWLRTGGSREEHAYHVSAFDSLKLQLSVQHDVTLQTDHSRFQGSSHYRGAWAKLLLLVCCGVRRDQTSESKFAIFAPCRQVFITCRRLGRDQSLRFCELDIQSGPERPEKAGAGEATLRGQNSYAVRPKSLSSTKWLTRAISDHR